MKISYKFNKIMDNQNRAQIKQDYESQKQPSLISSSRISGSKKVGLIVRRRSNTEAGDYAPSVTSSRNPSADQQIEQNKLPNPQPPSIMGASSTLTNNKVYGVIRETGKSKGKTLGLDTQASHALKNHTRSKSYQEQRAELQKQLVQLTMKKHQIEQLRENRKKLRIKLNQLQIELKQIKNSSGGNTKLNIAQQQGKASKIQTLKQLKHPKLKPIKLRQNTKPEQEFKAEFEQRLKNYNTRKVTRTQANDESDEDQVVDYFYEAELHHKCLNCKHYGIKKQDVRIPTQIKNDFNL